MAQLLREPRDKGTKAGCNCQHQAPMGYQYQASWHIAAPLHRADSFTPWCRNRDTNTELSIYFPSLCLFWWFPNLAPGSLTAHGVTANALEVIHRAVSNNASFPAVKRSMRRCTTVGSEFWGLLVICRAKIFWSYWLNPTSFLRKLHSLAGM